MIVVYLLVGLVGATGASIYSYLVLDASFWMVLAIYAGVGNMCVITTALGVLLLHRREQSRPASSDLAATENEESAIPALSWDLPADTLRATDSRAA